MICSINVSILCTKKVDFQVLMSSAQVSTFLKFVMNGCLNISSQSNLLNGFLLRVVVIKSLKLPETGIFFGNTISSVT